MAKGDLQSLTDKLAKKDLTVTQQIVHFLAEPSISSLSQIEFVIDTVPANLIVKTAKLRTSILGGNLPRRHAARKKKHMDPRMGPKIWTPFWEPQKEKTIRQTPKRGPDVVKNHSE